MMTRQEMVDEAVRRSMHIIDPHLRINGKNIGAPLHNFIPFLTAVRRTFKDISMDQAMLYPGSTIGHPGVISDLLRGSSY